MKEILVIFFWIIMFACCFWNACGFVLGHTYDYFCRRKTYHGIKTLLCFTILIVMYYIPWETFGIFTE